MAKGSKKTKEADGYRQARADLAEKGPERLYLPYGGEDYLLRTSWSGSGSVAWSRARRSSTTASSGARRWSSPVWRRR